MILRTLGFGRTYRHYILLPTNFNCRIFRPVFSSLRVCALMRNDWRLASFVFLLCLPSAITPAVCMMCWLVHMPRVCTDNVFQYVYAHQLSPAVDRYGCQLAYMASQTAHENSVRVFGSPSIPVYNAHYNYSGFVFLYDSSRILTAKLQCALLESLPTFHLRRLLFWLHFAGHLV